MLKSLSKSNKAALQKTGNKSHSQSKAVLKGNDSVQIQMSENFHTFHNGTLTYNWAKAAIKMGLSPA
jgi:hypothetical protein